MDLFLLGYLVHELEKYEDGIPSYIGYGTYEPTKIDKWLSKHPHIDAACTYAIGITIGLLPFGISMLVLYLYDLL